MSSPDAITSVEARVAASGSKSKRQLEESESPVKKVSRKRRKSGFQDDEDELGRDDSWDSDAIGYHRETYIPQKSLRRSERASIEDAKEDLDTRAAEDVREAAEAREMEKAQEARGAQEMEETPVAGGAPVAEEDRISDFVPEYGQTPPHKKTKTKSAASSSKQSSAAASEAPQPKKRGRKKKQPVVEEVFRDEDAGAQETSPAPAVIPTPATGTVQAVEKPKRKRGRPRKSDDINNDSTAEQGGGKIQGTEGEEAPPISQRQVSEGSNAKPDDGWKETTPEIPTDNENVQQGSKEVTASPKKSVSPLKDADSNTLLTSQSTTSTSEKATSTAKVAPSQPGKMAYRVGLSKRSRIAPLLKSLKK
jgi:hypothetical protein